MSDSKKVVDISQGRHRKEHERKDQKVESLRDRFTKALNLDDKPTKKGGLWKLKQKKKRKSDKPEPTGW
ncbi:MAG: hypothetical protein V7707_09470 [Motiliproteus sp.]